MTSTHTYVESVIPASKVRTTDRLVLQPGERQPLVIVQRTLPGGEVELWLDAVGATRIKLPANTPVKVKRRVTHLPE